jgi:mono/diheme cytochrome c family protein
MVLMSLLAIGPLVPQEAPAPPRSVNELKGFFRDHCVRCHGEDGSARDASGKKLGGLDFTAAAVAFREMTGPSSQRETRTMIRTIRKGIFFGITMPSWKSFLSEDEAALLVKEVLLKAEKGKAIAPESEPAR